MSELEQRLRRDAQRLTFQPDPDVSEGWRDQLRVADRAVNSVRRSPAPGWMFAAAAMVAVAALVAVRPSVEMSSPEPIFSALKTEQVARSVERVPQPLEAEAAAIARDLQRVREQTEQFIGFARSRIAADA